MIRKNLRKKLAEGDDSAVFLMKGRILKKYKFLYKREGAERSKNFIEKYIDFTKKIKEYVEKNNLNKFKIFLVELEDLEYGIESSRIPLDLEYNIILQGEELFIDEKGVVCSYGQKYVPGEDLDKTREDDYRAGLFFWKKSEEFVNLINEKFKTNFHIVPENVKLHKMYSKSKIEIDVTDLAARISESFT